jgi:hypothetical protein
MNDETKEALVGGAWALDWLASYGSLSTAASRETDAALIRAHIASETSAHDTGYAAAVADIVAWLCCDEDVARLWRAMEWPDGTKLWLADKIGVGAHVGAAKGGDDASI